MRTTTVSEGCVTAGATLWPVCLGGRDQCPTGFEDRDGLRNLFWERALEHLARPVDLQQFGLADPGRTASLPPWPGAEVCGAQPGAASPVPLPRVLLAQLWLARTDARPLPVLPAR